MARPYIARMDVVFTEPDGVDDKAMKRERLERLTKQNRDWATTRPEPEPKQEQSEAEEKTKATKPKKSKKKRKRRKAVVYAGDLVHDDDF